MGVHADGGLKIMIFQKFCFGPKSSPKAPFGVKIGASDAENHEESEKQKQNVPYFFLKKITKNAPTISKTKEKSSISRPPSA